ncbi:MAG: S41 family peptidase [Hyphomonadaceae bacterium]|nr:S41 family peptidase [Hyphomonadaceae bacterium]
MAKSKLSNIVSVATLLASGAILAACGGGGGGGGSTGTPILPVVSPPPPPASGPTWQQGVFEPATTFKDQCETPRSGVDIEGNPFPDEQGSLIEEQLWLRSWTNETYLWNDEVVDRDPAGFATAQAYFDVLKTDAVEPSGEDRDDFHFSELTEDFLASRNSVGNPGYGAEYAIIEGSPPRDIRIAYFEPGSPAGTAIGGQIPLPRGSRILEINGQDVINGFRTQAEVDVLIDLLFPSENGLTREFRVEDTDGTVRTVSLTTEDIIRQPILETKVITDGADKIGYIAFNTFSPFSSEEAIITAIEQVEAENVTDLVLDLRYNGGGLLAVAAQLGYMIAGPAQTNGKDFERFIFNADAGNLNPVDGTVNQPFPFISTVIKFDDNSSLVENAPLPSLDLNRVFILSTGDTCSASEAVINGLRGIDVEVILIGDTTCGKPYGFFPQDNCGRTYYTIQFQGANDKGFGDFADGFIPANSSAAFGVSVPGCQVADDFTKPLGDETERLLAAALDYRTTGACPTVTTKTATSFTANKSGPGSIGEDIRRQKYYLENVRDLRMPK